MRATEQDNACYILYFWLYHLFKRKSHFCNYIGMNRYGDGSFIWKDASSIKKTPWFMTLRLSLRECCGVAFMPHHDDVIKWKHFPRYWPFVRGIHRSPVNSPHRPVKRSFDVFVDLRSNKRLSKQSWGWWFKTPSCSLWRHCNVAKLVLRNIV